MAEFISNEQIEVKPGEPICITNKCTSPFEVGTGIVFKSDGLYHVIIEGNKITVSKDE